MRFLLRLQLRFYAYLPEVVNFKSESVLNFAEKVQKITASNLCQNDIRLLMIGMDDSAKGGMIIF